MSQKRSQKRIQLRCTINVLDDKTEALLGQVIDIHTAGLLFMSMEPFERNANYELRLVLPETIGGKSSISFECRCAWSKYEKEMGFHTIGMSAPDLSTETQEVISALIEKYGISK